MNHVETYVTGKDRVEPQFLPVKINNQTILMEIDSGAAMLIISVKTKEKYFEDIKMYAADVTLVNHDESPYIPIGMLKKG